MADSFDNALAEAVNGLYKAECVYGPGSNGWDGANHLEIATLGWVHWWNNDRLHGYSNHIPPVEYEEAYRASCDTEALQGA